LSAPAIIANIIAEGELVLFLPCDWRFLPKLGLRDDSRGLFFLAQSGGTAKQFLQPKRANQAGILLKSMLHCSYIAPPP
jgi:hypothetical protein